LRKDFSYIQMVISGGEMSKGVLSPSLGSVAPELLSARRFTNSSLGLDRRSGGAGPDGLRVTIIHSAVQITNLNVFLVAIILLSKPFLQRKVWKD